MFARRVGQLVFGAVVVLLASIVETAPVAGQGFCMPSDPDCFVEVTPDGGSTTSRYVNSGPFSFTFSLYNPSSSSVTVSLACWFALGSCSVSGSSSVTISSFQTVNKSVSYSTGSSTGSGTLRLTASGSGNSDNGQIVVPVIGPSVNITPPSATTIQTGASGSRIFQIQNTGSTAETYSFSCEKTGPVTCGSASPSSLTLQPQATPSNVTVNYTATSSPGNAVVKLKAHHSPTGINNYGNANVEVILYAVQTTPDGTNTPERYVNTSGHTAQFTVKNTGTSTNTFSFSCGGSSGVTCTNRSPTSAQLNPDQTQTVTATYSVGSTTGTGSLTLSASGSGGASNGGSFSVPINRYGVDVTPDGGQADSVNAGSDEHLLPFTVVNTGSTSNTFTLDCQGQSGVSCTEQISSVTVGAGQDTVVYGSVTAGSAPATGSVTLTASSNAGSGASNAGSYSIPVVTGAVAVIANQTSVPLKAPSTSGLETTITITNAGLVQNTFALSCTGTNGVTCTDVSPQSPTLGSGASTQATVTYATGSGSGLGKLTVVATDGLAADTTHTYIPFGTGVVAPLAMSPAGGNRTLQLQGGTTSYVRRQVVDDWPTTEFTVATRIRPTVSHQGGFFSYAVPGRDNEISLFLRNNASVDVWVRQVQEISAPTNVFDGDWHDIVVRWRSTDGRAEVFLDGTMVSSFTAGSGNQIGQGGAVVVGQEQDAVGGGYDAGQAFVGFVDDIQLYRRWLSDGEVIRLTGGGTETDAGLVLSWDFDDGSAIDLSGGGNTGTISNAPVIVEQPETDQLRGLCLTMSVGAGASECGDLRLLHGLPTIQTLNTVRAPTLIYNSAHAHPYPVVAFDAHLPTNAATPDSVRATMTVESVSGPVRTWSTSDWVQGQTRRMAVAWDGSSLGNGIHNYTVELRSYVGGADTTSTLSGQFTVVDRASSPFGAGWWLAGLEQLDVGDMVWTGGDGSVRKYESAGTDIWAARSLVRPDTIKLVSGKYVRYLPDSVKVRFDAQGRHVETENRLGYKTTFSYDGSGRLQTIALPTAGATSPTYTFAYTSGVLDSVIAPPMGSASRVTQVSNTSGRITGIQDPDGESVSFGYTGGLTNQITSRTDKRGTTVAFDYDEAQKVQSATVDMPSPQSDIVMTYRSAESVGVNGPVGGSAMAAVVDGPRNVADSTRFWVNALGQPTMIVNGLNDTTQIFYEDANMPGLASRIRHPNGWMQTSTYDSRGRVTSATDHSTSPVATTTYTWHSTWDAVTEIQPPVGGSTVFGIDTNNGNRLWAQDARGSSSRTNFQYDSSDPILLTRIIGPVNDTTEIDYDGLGNVDEVTSPLGFVTEYFKDGLGRDTMVLSPIESGKTLKQRIKYDILDRVDSTITIGPGMSGMPAETLFVKNTYDSQSGDLLSVSRWVSPDDGSVGTFSTGYLHDALGRPIRVLENGVADSTVYDAAGNVVEAITDRGHSTEMEYDALGRLIQRRLESVSYTATGCTQTECGFDFPKYPNEGSNLRIPGDTVLYFYDNMGNLDSTSNRFAKIWRTYAANGQMETDSVSLGTGNASYPKTYGIAYTYDLNGRRLELDHPSNLAPSGADPQRYAYTTFGAVDTIINILGNRYRYTYDNAGRMTRLDFPKGWEIRHYDKDGRPTRRRTWTANGSTLLRDDSLTYDRRGLVKTVDPVGSPEMWFDGVLAYSGHGQMVDMSGSGWPQQQVGDEITANALGSIIDKHGYYPGPRYSSDRRWTYAYTIGGKVAEVVELEPDAPPDDFRPDTTQYGYDLSGNQDEMAKFQQICVGETLPCDSSDPWTYRIRDGARSYYGPDQKLMVYQIHRDSVPAAGSPIDMDGTWEEYGYDPLGRRVYKRERRTDLCSTSYGKDRLCRAGEEWYVWDGDQILWEVREHESGGSGSAYFGKAGYTHGGVIDQPLDVVRTGYSGVLTLVLHTNWRNLFASATDTLGAQFGCEPVSSGGCEKMAWPAGSWHAWYDTDQTPDDPEWFGSLLHGQKDGSGLVYMRNRYYDPQSGQFTQQDPIGLAGGLNLYGFADGDPVNFSDPFGLCKRPKGKGVGICIESFIRASMFGAGNGRGVRADGGGYKTSHRFTLDPTSGAMKASKLDVGRTFGFKGYGDLSLTMEGSMQDGWNVTATASGVGTAFNTLGLGPGDEIDFTASLHVSPSGDVSLTGGAWDGFPSIEIWVYPEEGKPYLLLETGETNLQDLSGTPDRKFP